MALVCRACCCWGSCNNVCGRRGQSGHGTHSKQQIGRAGPENETLLERIRVSPPKWSNLKQGSGNRRRSVPGHEAGAWSRKARPVSAERRMGCLFWVVIPAAGVGSRHAGPDRPKQYFAWAIAPLIEHTLDCFLGQPGLNGLVVCLAPMMPGGRRWPVPQISGIQRAEGGRERADRCFPGCTNSPELGATGEVMGAACHPRARKCYCASDLHKLLERSAR